MTLSSFLRTLGLCCLLCGLGLTPKPSSAHSPPPPLEEALATVDSLRMHRQFETALHRLDSLAQAHPKTVAVHWRRALLRADLGKSADRKKHKRTFYKQSLDAAQTALSVDSTSAWAHLTMALAQGRLTLHAGPSERVRRSRSVRRHAERAIALDSTLAPAHHLLGLWHRGVADMNFLQRALVKTFYGGLPDASFEQSIHHLQRAIELESKPYNHLELGKTYLAMDRPEAARRQLQTALHTSGSPFDAEFKQEARALLDDLD